MSQKQSKKFRQMFRKTVGKRAKEMGEAVGNVMKPKPKWIPWFVWKFFLGFFIKIK